MTRPRIGWSDLAGKRVGIYGLGVEGRASLRACRARGIDPVLVDDNAAKNDDLAAELRDTQLVGTGSVAAGSRGAGAGSNEVLATDTGGLAALQQCDVVIKSPGISRYEAAVTSLQESGVAIVGGLGLWLAEADLARVLVITGTKGKSTTSAIAGHLLNHWGYRCFVGGNIGLPPYDPEVEADYDYWVIEVSSYQATDLPVTPPVTIVTSLHPDHLPWHHNDLEAYYRDKLSALSQPGADCTVANGHDPVIHAHKQMLAAHIRWVHVDNPADASADDKWIDGLGLLGRHNRGNALLAKSALNAMGFAETDDTAALTRAASGFAGLPSRLTIVGHADGVTFVDDGLSTNVLPTLAAIAAFADRRVALLVGGQSRGIDYQELGLGLRVRDQPLLLITMPTNGPEIHQQVAAIGPGPQVSVIDAESLPDAVRIASGWARPDGVVLLSPAAPSFDHFRNYQERSEVFIAAAQEAGAKRASQ